MKNIFLSKLAFLSPVKRDFSNFLSGKSEINADVFIHPLKYTVSLQIEKIVVDSKVSRQGIEIYKQKIANKEKTNPIIVVKHPSKDLYAVLDGHHRYYAYLEMGKKEIDCALAGDYSSVIFYLTEHGWFQPSVEITEGIRHPAIRLHQNLKQFLTNFVNSFCISENSSKICPAPFEFRLQPKKFKMLSKHLKNLLVTPNFSEKSVSLLDLRCFSGFFQ